MSAEKPLVFDLRKYTDSGEIDVELVASDLSSITLELADDPAKRITPFTYKQTENGEVVSVEYKGKKMEELLTWETPQDILASRASLMMRDQILTQKAPFVIVWLSSPDEKYGYKSGRVVVSIAKEEKGLNIIESYGIWTDMDKQQFLELGKHLGQISENKQENLTTTDDIREVTFCLNPGDQNALEFVSRNVSLPQYVWDKIDSGEVKQIHQKAYEDALVVVGQSREDLKNAKTYKEHVLVGARMEGGMESSGYSMSSDPSCPGALNSEAASSFASSSYVSIDAQRGLSSRSEVGVFCRECPFCHRKINAVIFPGYICSCGQIYNGSCGSEVKSDKADKNEEEENLLPEAGIFLFFFFLFAGATIGTSK